MPDIKDILATPGAIPNAKFGSAINYTEIENDGTPIQYGDSTIWDDLTGSLVSRRLTSVSGKLDYNFDENSITMQSGGLITNADDRLIFNFQKPHGAKISSLFKLHIHWEQSTTNKIEFTTQYRIQENNNIKNTTWTTVTTNSVDNSNFVYPGSGIFNQITSLVSVDWYNVHLSSTIQFRVARTDSTVGDIEAVFVDGHVERDCYGSRQEYIK